MLKGAGAVASPCDGADNPSTTTSVPTMTSNTAPSGEASASSVYSGSYFAFGAFDGIEVGGAGNWLSQTPHGTTESLQYEYDTSIAINKYSIMSRITAFPTAFKLQGSNNGGVDYDDLDSRSGVTPINDTYVTFTFINSTKYTHYRLLISAFDNVGYVRIIEFKLIEAQCA